MPYEIPSLAALVQGATTDLNRQGVDEFLRHSDSAVLARVMAAGTFGLYGHQAWMAKQILPDTCDEDILERWATLKGVGRTQPASASGLVSVEGTTGIQVGAGFEWQDRAGRKVVAVEDTVLVNGRAKVPAQAVDAGVLGNLPSGIQLTAVSPLAGLVANAEVEAAGFSGGADIEAVEAWRRRVVRAFRIQPHGGNADDYETWALECAGVTRAWCIPAWSGPGTVAVFFVRDGRDDILPTADEVEDVKAHINSVRPVTAELHCAGPVLLPVHYKITIRPDTAATRASVEKALRQLHEDSSDLGARMYRSHMTAAISGAPGENDHELFEPVGDVVPSRGQLPVFGGIEWV